MLYVLSMNKSVLLIIRLALLSQDLRADVHQQLIQAEPVSHVGGVGYVDSAMRVLSSWSVDYSLPCMPVSSRSSTWPFVSSLPVSCVLVYV